VVDSEEIESKLTMVLNWAGKNKQFDPAFVQSLAEFYEKNGKLSEKQLMALDKIIDRWDIALETESEDAFDRSMEKE